MACPRSLIPSKDERVKELRRIAGEFILLECQDTQCMWNNGTHAQLSALIRSTCSCSDERPADLIATTFFGIRVDIDCDDIGCVSCPLSFNYPVVERKGFHGERLTCLKGQRRDVPLEGCPLSRPWGCVLLTMKKKGYGRRRSKT